MSGDQVVSSDRFEAGWSVLANIDNTTHSITNLHIACFFHSELFSFFPARSCFLYFFLLYSMELLLVDSLQKFTAKLEDCVTSSSLCKFALCENGPNKINKLSYLQKKRCIIYWLFYWTPYIFFQKAEGC